MGRIASAAAASWFLWGVGYYMYYAYLSPYMAEFVQPKYISLAYVTSQLAALVFPMVGYMVYRRLGVKAAIVLGMSLAGLGIMLLGVARDLASFALLLSLNQAFYIALAPYYALMAQEGTSSIPLVWAISVAPSLFMPTVGGLVISTMGFPFEFALAGVMIALSAIPMMALSGLKAAEGSWRVRGWALALPAIVPVALESPYIFLVLQRSYHLSDVQLGALASTAEAIGMAAAFVFRGRKWGISAALIGFSATALSSVSWAFGASFGFWEAVVPLAIAYLSPEGGIRFYTLVVTLQAAAFLGGYALSTAIASANYLLVPLVGGIMSLAAAAFYAARGWRRARAT